MWYREIINFLGFVAPWVIFGSVGSMAVFRVVMFVESRKNTASKKMRMRK